MPYRPFVDYSTDAEYRAHFTRVYCPEPVVTFDGISVAFYPERFDHAFYGGALKDQFARERARRIDWIGEALRDGHARLCVGWDTPRKRYDNSRRVVLVGGDYVVVTQLWGQKGQRRGLFVTAFIVDNPRTLSQIRSAPRWEDV